MSRDIPPNFGADALDDPFWDGCRRHEFLLHVCSVCQRAYWPASSCIDHGWAPMTWRPSSGRGHIHTYTVFHHAYMPVEVVFRDEDDGWVIPHFRPVR